MTSTEGDIANPYSVSPAAGAVVSAARSSAARPNHLASKLTSVLIAIVMLGAGAWSVSLAVLNASPNAAVNYVMNTTQFDDGDFWQLAEATTSIRVTSVISLGVVGAAYTALGVWIIIRLSSSFLLGGKMISSKARRVVAQKASPMSLVSWLNAYPNRRKCWNLMLELVEIILQLVTLHDLLEGGDQAPIVVGYVALMALNSCTCFYVIVLSWKKHDLHHEVVVDAILDICFAVGFPAAQTMFAIQNFRGDLKTVAIRQKYFPPKPFERKARLFVDPVQIAIFSTTLASLRMDSVHEVFVRLAFNVFACARWFRIVRRWLSFTKSQRGNHSQSNPSDVVVPTRAIPSFVGYLFLVFAVLVVLYTKEAIEVSRSDCASSSVCPCLVFIAQNLQSGPRDQDPPNIIGNLSALAEAGTLQTIQIVNNAITPTMPENVGGCSNLRQLILINSAVESLPDWASRAFSKLEYLHVESARMGPHLAPLASDLFSRMSSLRTLVLVNQDELTSLPSMDRVINLQTLYLERSVSLTELPSLSAATKLQNLVLDTIRNLPRFPDWSGQAPMGMVYIQGAALCCNGFLTNGVSNTSAIPCSWSCPGLCFGDSEAANWSLPSSSTLKALQPFIDSKNVCDPSYKLQLRNILERGAIQCTLYSQCRGGICYSPGFDPPTCMDDPAIIEMRKEMIRGGASCNPVDEAWLGCA